MSTTCATIRYTFRLLLSLVVFSACTHIHSEDLLGSWSVDQLVEDGMDKTDQLPSRRWGTAITLTRDGRFRTNSREHSHGTWKINPEAGRIYFYFPQDNGDYRPWNVLLNGDQLVLKATTQQLYLSRADDMPALPPVTVDLRNNLPGTWYFYQMKTDSSVVYYPQKKRRARWMRINKSGVYQSGEGTSAPLRGRWVLTHDTLTFSDFNQPWKKSWRINIDPDGVLYFRTLSHDTTQFEQVSFIHETNLP